MAYVDQATKAKLAPTIKAILKKYRVKGTIAVRNHMTLVLNIKSGSIDFIGNYNRVVSESNRFQCDPTSFRPATDSLDVNTYWYQDQFDGTAKSFLSEIIAAMKGPEFFDHSDAMTDYFHTSHYLDINIGSWNKPYAVE